MANESRTARPIMSFCIAINLRPPLRNHLEELGNGAKRQGREEAQGTDQQNDEHEQEYEHAVGGRQGTGALGDLTLLGQRAGDSQRTDDGHEACEQHLEAEHDVDPGNVAVHACKRRAVVAAA